ncbi:hypothetical protein BRD01_11870 [Halobacteriales archaeon QS_8_65_32]|nr:MAG: hypothetical protein BRD01_11870 [Halobacteriales archaeon QS_8_65_32]
MVGEARENLADCSRPFAFAVAAAESIPFRSNAFDAATANFMLYHVPDRKRALAEIRRVLETRRNASRSHVRRGAPAGATRGPGGGSRRGAPPRHELSAGERPRATRPLLRVRRLSPVRRRTRRHRGRTAGRVGALARGVRRVGRRGARRGVRRALRGWRVPRSEGHGSVRRTGSRVAVLSVVGHRFVRPVIVLIVVGTVILPVLSSEPSVPPSGPSFESSATAGSG